MRHAHRCCLFPLMAVSWCLSAAAQAPGDPVVKPYPGSVLSSSQDRGFNEFRFVTGTNTAGATDEERLPSVLATGNLVQFAYENPSDRSMLEVFANYKEGLERAGFSILFECADAGCGPLRQVIGRLNGSRYTAPEMRFLTAKLSQGDRDTYVQVNLTKPRHELYILETAAMERGLVVVTPAAIEQGLLTDGRVVLDGIFFDLDEATLEPESKPALDAIAKFLGDHPELKAYVVGHTDRTGDFEHNLALSKARAASVIAALADDHGIARGRLVAHGIGPLSPARTNRSDSGRAENRRVELVEM